MINYVKLIALFAVALPFFAQAQDEINVLKRSELSLAPTCVESNTNSDWSWWNSSNDSSGFSPMDVDGVKSVVVTPSLMPPYYGPFEMQQYAQRYQRACDIAFHYGIFYDEGRVRVIELRSTEHQGAFWQGKNNNIGVVVHGLNMHDPRVKNAIKGLVLTKLVDDFPNISEIISRDDASASIKNVVAEIDSDIFTTEE